MAEGDTHTTNPLESTIFEKPHLEKFAITPTPSLAPARRVRSGNGIQAELNPVIFS